MKKKIVIQLLILVWMSSCVTYKHMMYVEGTQELQQKLPKLALEIDTNSISTVFNQIPYVYGEYLPTNIITIGLVPPNKDYILIPETQLELKINSLPENYKKIFNEAISLQKIIVITNKEYSIPNIEGKGVSNWGSNWQNNKINLNKIVLYRNSTEFCSANPAFQVKKVGVKIDHLSPFSTEITRSKLPEPFVTRSSHDMSLIINDKSRNLNTISRSNEPFGTWQLTTGSELCLKGMTHDAYIVENRFSGSYDLRIVDQLVYLKNVVENKICDQNSELKGKIKFEVLNSELIFNWGWFIPSSLTLYTINLLGFPLVGQSVKLTLKCSITDNNNNEVYSKVVSVKGSSLCAMYWGYGGYGGAILSGQGGIHRSSNMKAISKAVNLIIEDITLNKSQILSLLK